MIVGSDGGRPNLSVIIPTWNTRRLTVSCVQSVVAQGPSTDIIVVDDGSDDGTREELEERYPSVRVLSTGERAGFTRSANLGLAASRGQLLLLLNSDTELLQGALTHLLAAFDQDPRLGVAGGRLSFPDGQPQWSGGREPSLIWLFLQSSDLGGVLGRIPGLRKIWPVSGHRDAPVEWVTGAALAARREVIEEIGLLDERFQLYAQDLDYCVRARLAGWKLEVVSGFDVMHHLGSTIESLEGSSKARRHEALMAADLIRWYGKNHGRWRGALARVAVLLGRFVKKLLPARRSASSGTLGKEP